MLIFNEIPTPLSGALSDNSITSYDIIGAAKNGYLPTVPAICIARYCRGISGSGFQQAILHTGIRYHKYIPPGGKIQYRLSDFVEFLQNRRVSPEPFQFPPVGKKNAFWGSTDRR